MFDEDLKVHMAFMILWTPHIGLTFPLLYNMQVILKIQRLSHPLKVDVLCKTQIISKKKICNSQLHALCMKLIAMLKSASHKCLFVIYALL